jgi:hypothetical protein
VGSRTYRVTVRGQFDRLDDAQRAELVADAADHAVAYAAFTEAGNLSYDLAADPVFAFRYLVTVDVTVDGDEDPDAGPTAAAARGAGAARAWLSTRGYGHRRLRASADSVPASPAGH